MAGSRPLRSRLERLRRRRPLADTAEADRLRAEWLDAQRQTAARAVEIKKRRDLGEPVDTTGGTGVELHAEMVSYGKPENVPEELFDRLDERICRVVPEPYREQYSQIVAAGIFAAFDHFEELEEREE